MKIPRLTNKMRIKPKGKSFIYVLLGEMTHRIKIGRTTRMKARIKAIQSSSPDKLKLLIAFEGFEEEEEILHEMIKDRRIHGEWFDPDSEFINFLSSIELIGFKAALKEFRLTKGECRNKE